MLPVLSALPYSDPSPLHGSSGAPRAPKQRAFDRAAPRRFYADMHAPGPVHLAALDSPLPVSVAQQASRFIHLVGHATPDGQHGIAAQLFGLDGVQHVTQRYAHGRPPVDKFKRDVLNHYRKNNPDAWETLRNAGNALRHYHSAPRGNTEPVFGLPLPFIPGAGSSWPAGSIWAAHYARVLVELGRALEQASVRSARPLALTHTAPKVTPRHAALNRGDALQVSAPLFLVQRTDGAWTVASGDPLALIKHVKGPHGLALQAIPHPPVTCPGATPDDVRVWAERWLWWLENHSRMFHTMAIGV